MAAEKNNDHRRDCGAAGAASQGWSRRCRYRRLPSLCGHALVPPGSIPGVRRAANTQLANNDAKIKLALLIVTTNGGGAASTVPNRFVPQPSGRHQGALSALDLTRSRSDALSL
jgi:hypothetical protein